MKYTIVEALKLLFIVALEIFLARVKCEDWSVDVQRGEVLGSDVDCEYRSAAEEKVAEGCFFESWGGTFSRSSLQAFYNALKLMLRHEPGTSSSGDVREKLVDAACVRGHFVKLFDESR